MLPRLIVGLGNPGPEYVGTRHNVGFEVLDAVLARVPSPPELVHKHDGLFCSARFAGRSLCFLKPIAYMNNSGDVIEKLVRSLDLAADEVLVVYDCIDLPLGRIRLRQKGSSGGHRGVESIIEKLRTDQFPRLRVGIGRPDRATIDYVLSSWDTDELPLVQEVVGVSVDALLLAIRRGVPVAMNAFNAWSPVPESDTSGEN